MAPLRHFGVAALVGAAAVAAAAAVAVIPPAAAAPPAGVPVSVPLTNASGDYRFYSTALYPSLADRCLYRLSIASAYALSGTHGSVAGLPPSAIAVNGTTCGGGAALLASSTALAGDEPAAELSDLRTALALYDTAGALGLLERTLAAPVTVLLVRQAVTCGDPAGGGAELPTGTVGFLFAPSSPLEVVPGVALSPPHRALYMPNPDGSVCLLTTERFAADKTPPPSLTAGGGGANQQAAGGGAVASPTAAPTAAAPAADNGGSCFPASARVAVAGGRTKRMDEVTTGDDLAVTHTTSSRVFGWSHRVAARTTTFVALTAAHEAAPLLLSPSHYLYVNGRLAAASTVAVGDALTTASGAPAAVTAVGRVAAAGLYAPHTLHGELVVGGVRVSSYTQAVHPAVAHALLAPVRAAFRWGVPEPLGGMLYEGREGVLGQTLGRLLPRGW
ncbi:hypothetical protein I4F81_008148 [Pyropia yezoensis]|uniref:Uncharacterized protein n=1 Tax=Pyropia yezoensis TaxID=2788 RepID=A0ACC3C679_PYRYE|nr:hypothetical protein I4F81_008148 [Neopyropia yezoensis]